MNNPQQSLQNYIQNIKRLDELTKYLELLKVKGLTLDRQEAIFDFESITAEMKAIEATLAGK